MADKEKKKGRWNTKIWISWEWKELFTCNKKHIFEGISFGEKLKFAKK